MELAAQIVGIIAVLLFAISYQPKKRAAIITLNATSRVLYVIQYIMLGAFAGAILDVVGLVASVIASQKSKLKNKSTIVLILVLTFIAFVGTLVAILNHSLIDLLPVFGVCLQITALWANNANTIRKISLISAPCWLSYNLISKAYGSVIGDIVGILSICIALIRNKRENKKQQ